MRKLGVGGAASVGAKAFANILATSVTGRPLRRRSNTSSPPPRSLRRNCDHPVLSSKHFMEQTPRRGCFGGNLASGNSAYRRGRHMDFDGTACRLTRVVTKPPTGGFVAQTDGTSFFPARRQLVHPASNNALKRRKTAFAVYLHLDPECLLVYHRCIKTHKTGITTYRIYHGFGD